MKQKKLKYIYSKLDNYFIKKESGFHSIIKRILQFNSKIDLQYNYRKCKVVFVLTKKTSSYTFAQNLIYNKTNLRGLSFLLVSNPFLGNWFLLFPPQPSMMKRFSGNYVQLLSNKTAPHRPVTKKNLTVPSLKSSILCSRKPRIKAQTRPLNMCVILTL